MSESFYKVMNILELVNYIQYYTDLRHLFSASKGLLSWRRELQYWKLNQHNSIKYHNNREFRQTIEQIVSDTSTQISLDLSRCENITDVSALGNVHTLDLSHCENITDVSALGNVHELDLSYCDKIIDGSALI